MDYTKKTILIAIVFCVVLAGVCTVGTAGEEGKSRVIHFPKDRSLGRIKVKDADIIKGHQDYHDWYVKAEDLGEARGDIVIPAGRKVALFLYAKDIGDLSPLSELKPDDICMLSLTGLFENQPLLSDESMQYITHLTGLKYLWLSFAKTTTKVIEPITKLQSLEMLVPPQGLTNKGLSYVAQVKSLKVLYFGKNKVTNAGLRRYLPKLTKLEKLGLYSGHISDDGLVCLAELPMLNDLSLNSGNFTDAGLAHVKNISSLKVLDLGHLPVTDEGVRHISSIAGLEDLNLYKTEVTDRGLKFIKSLPSLKKLNLGGTKITDKGLSYLSEIKSLEYLDLPSETVTDKNLVYLTQLTNLKSLNMPSPHYVDPKTDKRLYTDKGLKELIKLQSLEELRLAGLGVTDVGMSYIAKLGNLKELSLFGCSITNKGLAKLKTLKSLERLTLRCENVTISGLSHLNALKNLSDLQVGDIKQDNSGLDISGLSKLEELSLRLDCSRKGRELICDPVRDEDMASLGKLKKLRWLGISSRNSMVTDAGIAYLKDLPNVGYFAFGSPYLTDKSLSYLASIKTLKTLIITGNFTDEGLGYLEELKGLLRLEIYSANKFSPAALKQIKEKLPVLTSFTAEQDRDISVERR